MTAIHRREMLGGMLGGAAVATAGLSMIPVPAESAPYCPANRVPNWAPTVPRGVRRRKACWWWGGPVEETSNLLLALAHAAWLGQAFAHCPLRVLGTKSDAGDMGAGRPRQDSHTFIVTGGGQDFVRLRPARLWHPDAAAPLRRLRWRVRLRTGGRPARHQGRHPYPGIVRTPACPL
jgi:hypothetical protein